MWNWFIWLRLELIILFSPLIEEYKNSILVICTFTGARIHKIQFTQFEYEWMQKNDPVLDWAGDELNAGKHWSMTTSRKVIKCPRHICRLVNTERFSQAALKIEPIESWMMNVGLSLPFDDKFQTVYPPAVWNANIKHYFMTGKINK